MAKIKLEYDFTEYIAKRKQKLTSNLVTRIFNERKFFENPNWTKLYKVQYEWLKNYSLPIYTVRFDDEVILRRFPKGLTPSEGIRFKIENFAENRLVDGSFVHE